MPAPDEEKKQPTTVYYQTNTEETQIVNGNKDAAPYQVAAVVCTAISFTLVYSAFYSLISLQSSIQEVKGLGNAAIAVIHAAETVSCAVIPGLSLLLSRKRTILLGLSAFVVYYAANFHPIPPMVLAAATILGLTAGSLWGIQAAFINRLAWRRSLTVDISAAGLISRYHGLFLAIFQTSHVFSHILTTIFIHNVESNWSPMAANDTNSSNNCGYLHLGMDDELEKSPQNNTQTISWWQFRLLVGSYILVSLVGVILFYVKVNDVDYYYRSDSNGVLLNLINGSKAVFSHFKDAQLLKIVPLVLFTGIEQGYIFTDFTKLFVSCTLGVSHVGRVMLCFGVANSLCSILAGLLHTVIRRSIIVGFGAMFAFCSFFVMLQWRPVSDDDGMFYVLASVFGVCDAIWVTQTRGLIGTKFFRSSDSVFIFYRMIQACGFSMSTGYSYFLPVSIKIYVMLVILAIALIGFSWFEMNEKNNGLMLELSSGSKRVSL